MIRTLGVNPLTPKGAACQNSTFWMTATLARHISFIQSPFLTKIVGMNSNSNLVFVVKNLVGSKMLQRFGMHFSARGSNFGLYL